MVFFLVIFGSVLGHVFGHFYVNVLVNFGSILGQFWVIFWSFLGLALSSKWKEVCDCFRLTCYTGHRRGEVRDVCGGFESAGDCQQAAGTRLRPAETGAAPPADQRTRQRHRDPSPHPRGSLHC